MKALLHEFDSRATKRIQQWPSWVRPSMLLATLIGQPIFTVGIAALIAGIGWGAANIGWFVAGSIAVVTFGVSVVAKLYFHRDRPVTEYVAQMRFDTYSMPSGHGAGAMASYGLVAAVLYPMLAVPFGYIAVCLIALMIGLIGVSRIYLGAHYPSDVMAGWLLGLLGLTASIIGLQISAY